MGRINCKLRLCMTLLVCNILFIWGNSLLPGSVSGAISGWIRDILAAIFPMGPDKPDAGHGLLRKLAHFTEFACLGALFGWFFHMLTKPVVFATVCGFLVACVDEIIQRFIPDRGPSFKDVLIDTSGAVVGMCILLAGYMIVKRRSNKPLEDTTK